MLAASWEEVTAGEIQRVEDALGQPQGAPESGGGGHPCPAGGHPGRPAAQGVAISVGGPFGRVPGDPVSGGVQRKPVVFHFPDPSARQKRRVGVNLDDGIAIRRPLGQRGNDSPDALRAAQIAAAGERAPAIPRPIRLS